VTMYGNEISDHLFYQLVKEGSIFSNTLINQNFSIVSVTDDKITCRILSKLKRGHSKTPVEFTLSKTLFKQYMSLTGQSIPTFVKVR
jgi:hypothetical protein